jgi:glycosyltransferase involved in cell wall biosynthesis
MLKGKSIVVVVPAYNEEKLIGRVIKSMPDFVDKIVIVNDCSKDRTSEIVKEYQAREPEKIIFIEHEINTGVGGAISTGYIWCRENNVDVAVVMAGDNQMDPEDLPALLAPIVDDKADYSKGNRLITGEAWKKIPRVRYLGNSMLSFLTKIASGYWHIVDSQSGYTALNKKALHLIPLEEIYPRYGMPNDLLVTLNIYNMRVVDVPVRPVYGEDKSGIKIQKVIFTLSFLLAKIFIKRMVQKYIIRDFHPLVMFYFLGLLMFFLDIPLIIRFFTRWITLGVIPEITLLTFIFCTVSGMQLLLFAMLFDMEANKDLKVTV